MDVTKDLDVGTDVILFSAELEGSTELCVTTGEKLELRLREEMLSLTEPEGDIADESV